MSNILLHFPAYVWILAGFGFTLAVGFIWLLKNLCFWEDRVNYAHDFREGFIKYANSNGSDMATYRTLLLLANRMQREMGQFGTYASFQLPYQQVIYRNYPIILNMIPALRQLFSDNDTGLFHSQIGHYVHAIDEALLRYIGSVRDRLQQRKKELFNPLYWLRRGVEQLLSIPLGFLSFFNIVDGGSIEKIQASLLFKLISMVIVLIGTLSSMVTIAIGWDQTVELLNKIIQS